MSFENFTQRPVSQDGAEPKSNLDTMLEKAESRNRLGSIKQYLQNLSQALAAGALLVLAPMSSQAEADTSGGYLESVTTEELGQSFSGNPESSGYSEYLMHNPDAVRQIGEEIMDLLDTNSINEETFEKICKLMPRIDDSSSEMSGYQISENNESKIINLNLFGSNKQDDNNLNSYLLTGEMVVGNDGNIDYIITSIDANSGTQKCMTNRGLVNK